VHGEEKSRLIQTLAGTLNLFSCISGAINIKPATTGVPVITKAEGLSMVIQGGPSMARSK
jgi:hypothetical protein